MSQVLKIQPTIEVEIPDGTVLVSEDELELLQKGSLAGKVWNIDDLRKWIGNKDVKWVKEFILYRPAFEMDMKRMDRQELIHISSGRGDKWWFKASVMSAWIDDHWNQINWNGKL